MTTPNFMRALAEGPAGTVTIQITTTAAPVLGYHATVAELATEVADVPDEALAALPDALPPLRRAVTEALVNVPDGQPALTRAIARLDRSLAEIAAGVPTTPVGLSLQLVDVVLALGDVPPARSVVARHALADLLGVIAAVSGKLLGEARRLEAAASEPDWLADVELPTALVGDGEAAAPRPVKPLARVGAFLGGLTCSLLAALVLPLR